MPARRGHDRPILLAMLTALGVLVQSATGLPQDPPDVDLPATEQRIKRLLENMDDEQLIAEGRSQALDEAIELRAGMIRAAPEDPRRGIWHADQAEDSCSNGSSFRTAGRPTC